MTLAKLSLAAATLSLFATTACVDVNDKSNPNYNAQQGAIAGALTGALIGVAAGDNANERRNAALFGAVVGGAIGNSIGARLDAQEAELRAATGGNVGIVNTGSQLIVTMPEDILFATDSASLTGRLQNDLYAVANNLNRYPNTTVNVVGHTDNVGPAAYNMDLSQRRAQAVASVLINAGVAPYRIRSIGRGEDQPIATNLTPEGRAQNRRVEIIITPDA